MDRTRRHDAMSAASSSRKLFATVWNFLRVHTRPARRFVSYRIYRWPLPPQFGDGTAISCSGFGEDCVALGWLVDAGVAPNDIRYLDVGASDPVALSNTMAMYRRGAKGVLVEPDSSMAKKLRSRRPRDTVIDAAVAFDERRAATLIRLHPSAFNTFSEAQAERVVAASAGWPA